jgi:hypothetical protein
VSDRNGTILPMWIGAHQASPAEIAMTPKHVDRRTASLATAP